MREDLDPAARQCLAFLVVTLLSLLALPATAAVERYKTESAYLARLSQLGLQSLTEGFESSAWDAARSPNINDRHALPQVISQTLLWEPAAKDVWGSAYSTKAHGVTTNHNWARSGLWGIYEDHNGEAYPTTIRVTAPVTIFAIGGWFDTNPDGQSVGFLFEDRTVANDPGYVMPGYGAMYPGDNPSFGHEFVGIVDPDGFTSVILTGTLQLNEENVLEGGNIFGADDFTFGIPQGAFDYPGDANHDGMVNLADLQILGDHWQSSAAGWTEADFTGDGNVNLADLQILGDHWGHGVSADISFDQAVQQAGLAIPEPACFALLSFGLMITTCHRPSAFSQCLMA